MQTQAHSAFTGILNTFEAEHGLRDFKFGPTAGDYTGTAEQRTGQFFASVSALLTGSREEIDIDTL